MPSRTLYTHTVQAKVTPTSSVSGRRTKIIATVGPASWDPPVLERLIEAGVDVFRLNFSHADRERHAGTIEAIRAAAERVGREVAILGDLPGPKLRIGELRDDVAELETGMHVKLTPGDFEGDRRTIPVAWPGVTSLREDEHVYLADGVDPPAGRRGSDGDGVDRRGRGRGDALLPQGDEHPRRDRDRRDHRRRPRLGRVRGRAEPRPARGLLRLDRRRPRAGRRSGCARSAPTIPLIAKIEKRQAAENAAEIVRAATGGIMVARGDLGIELPIAEVPVVQKRLIREAGLRSKPAITATQMLASMVHAKRPTRAEVTDVANAIYDGTDAVMLSEETAVGQNPVEAVRVMDRIARATEPDLRYGEWLFTRTDQATQDVADSVAQSAVGAVYRLGLAAMVVPTNSGRTARLVSAHRPERARCWRSRRASRRCAGVSLLFGVTAIQAEHDDDIRGLLDDCAALAAEHGIAKSGDLIAITAGLSVQELGTNLFEVHRVPEAALRTCGRPI